MSAIPLLLASLSLALPDAPAKARLEYTLRVDSSDLSGVTVELRVRNAPTSLRLAAHAHPEYDDRYWRYIEALRAEGPQGQALPVAREDSVIWRVDHPAGDVVIRYRVRYPVEGIPRAAWRPFLAPTGGLIGGPHTFLYVVGEEGAPVTVTLDLPRSWRVASGLSGRPTDRAFGAPDPHTLMESPMLVGAMSEWSFEAKGIPHRIFYWRLPGGIPFDTVAFADGIERLVTAALDLFTRAPYREYTFLFQDGAFGGGLEHPNSVTLGAPSADLASNPHGSLPETAHEFVHTWNLMAFRPVEYRGLDFRTQPPVAGLWFSEGLTLFYADLLLRRARLPVRDSTRIEHLARLIERYLAAPGNARFSAEQISRTTYNASPGALGDYSASAHLVGELLGTVLDLVIRGATDGTRSMDGVMRLMFERFAARGFTGSDIESATSEICSCNAGPIFARHVRSAGAIDFDRYLEPLGLRLRVSREPAVDGEGRPARDLRLWGWQEGNPPTLRLRISDPSSLWGRAGLHTNDAVETIDGAPVKSWPELREFLAGFAIGDSAAIVVEREGKRFETMVVMRGFERPIVRIESLPEPTARQLRLRRAWLEGN